MSWLGDLGDLGDIASSAGASTYARGAIMSAGALAGASGAEVLGQLRAAGLGIRTQDFYRQYGTINQAIAGNASDLSLEVDASTGQLLPGEPPEDWNGKYIHQVTATWRTPGDEGEYDLQQRTLGIVSTVPLSPLEASQAALQIIESPIDTDDTDNYAQPGDLLSLSLTGAWYGTSPGVQGI